MAVVTVEGRFHFWTKSELFKMKDNGELAFLDDAIEQKVVQAPFERKQEAIFGVEYFVSGGIVNVYRVKQVTHENFAEFLKD